jgi:hypothetical protein
MNDLKGHEGLDPTGKLTLRGEKAIRTYVLRLCAIPSAILSGGLFILGFMMNEVARGSAYNDAYKDAQDQILAFASRAIEAAQSAKSSADQIDATKGAALAAKVEADAVIASLRTAGETASAVASGQEVTDGVANALLKNDVFLKTVKLRLTNDQPLEMVGYGDGVHAWQPKSANCPEGAYVVGIRVDHGGTCGNRCDPDGAPIRQITLSCRRF